MIRRAGASIIALSLAAGTAGAQQRTQGRAQDGQAVYWVTAATTSGMAAGSAGMGAMSPSSSAVAGMPPGYPPPVPDMGSTVGSAAGEAVGRAIGGRGGAVAGALGSALGGMLGRRAARRGQPPAPPAAAPPPQAAPQPAVNSVRTLTLQLGSARTAPGQPSAEHLPPAGLQAGPSLPLVSPTPSAGTGYAPTSPASTATPRGRMLIYWGCGDRAAAAPIVIDLARLSTASASAFPQIALNLPEPPSAGRHATYGEWPNAQSRTTVPAGGSLVGSHTVRGNYSPEIRFDLGSTHDFMAPLNVTGQSRTAAGGTRMTWNAVPGATGYFAYMIGSGGEPDTTVLWTSSATAASFGPLIDYIPPTEARRLVAQRVVMSPQTTECTVPSEVTRAAPSGFVQLTAYGDEVNVSQPRPATAPRNWRPEWTTKVRFKSATSLFLREQG